MKKIIFTLWLLVFIKPYFGFILNDINPEMLGSSVLNDDNEIEQDNMVDILKKIRFTFPGTKWCGPGDIADNYDDLGTEKEADKCCREHDYCPDVIAGGGTKYNLTNTAFHSRLSCDCDNTFYQCMKSAGTQTARLIGNIYFNSLHTKCYRKDYPVIECIQKGGWFKTKCLKHSHDTSKEQLYQWFDVQDF